MKLCVHYGETDLYKMKTYVLPKTLQVQTKPKQFLNHPTTLSSIFLDLWVLPVSGNVCHARRKGEVTLPLEYLQRKGLRSLTGKSCVYEIFNLCFTKIRSFNLSESFELFTVIVSPFFRKE